MDMPLVSIIIPVFNVEQYIGKCLESVISQTYHNLEVICVEDCSTDRSAQILEQFIKIDSRINIIFHHENGGLSRARNSGLKIINGDYVTFIDSDDFIAENFVEKLICKICRTKADFVLASTVEFEDDNISNKQIYTLQVRFDDVYDRETIVHSMINYPVTAWAKLYRTSFLKKNNLSFINGLLHEDEPWSMLLYAKATSVGFAENAYYFYRKRRYGSITAERDHITIEYCYKYLETLRKMSEINNALIMENTFDKMTYGLYQEKIIKMAYWTMKKLNKSRHNNAVKKRVFNEYKIFLNSLGVYKINVCTLILSLFNAKDFKRNKIIYKLFKM